ncbi:hypothetical protein MN116_007446 [Schistosoma mekongi]|uniref:TOG domain-containing protein n=1 Tax=Schistosoma mekongi TaxID=38744 RepID=A0AAE2D3H7_SCHME|nr:hypothetical protein MN116_007446 [Schistosoma mekongi]
MVINYVDEFLFKMQDNNLIFRLETIYSQHSDFNQFTWYSYALLDDVINHYNVKYFSLYTINALGKFISYIIKNYGQVDYLNMKCIETLSYLFTSPYFSIKLKNTLMHILEMDISLNLLNKQSYIDQYTWNCICDYIIHCNNILPPIRILIYVGIYTSYNLIEYKHCFIKLHHLIKILSKYKIDFFEIVITLKLLIEKMKQSHSIIKLFCLNIIQLIYWNIDKLDYQNAIKCIQSELFTTLDNNLNLNYLSSFNDNLKILNKRVNSFTFNELFNKTELLVTIPNYIYTLLYDKYNQSMQLKGIDALCLFTWKMYCSKNSYQLYANFQCYAKNIHYYLISILNIMQNQSTHMIIHLSYIILVQSAAAECCAVLIGLYNTENHMSILYTIKNLLLNDMSNIEVNFLLQKIKKCIQCKNYNDNLTEQNDLFEVESDVEQKSMRAIPHLNYSDHAVDKSISRNSLRTFNMYKMPIDLNRINHLNGSYFHISEDRKRLKSYKSDNLESIQKTSVTMKTHDFSAQRLNQLDHEKKISDKLITTDVIPNIQNSLRMEPINCPVNWYNQSPGDKMNQCLESLRDSVSRRRKQWLFDQLAKLNAEKSIESNQKNLSQMKTFNEENHNLPIHSVSDVWTAQDNGIYLRASNDEIDQPIYKYHDNLPNNWRDNTVNSLNRQFCVQSTCSVSDKASRGMNDLHLPTNKEQSKTEYNNYKNQEKQTIAKQQKLKYLSSYKEKVKKDTHFLRKTTDHSIGVDKKIINKSIKIEEKLIEYLTSKNWEEQIKAANIIQNLLETMNVKPLEILFSDKQSMNILVSGIEQAIKCLRSQVSHQGLKTLQKLCNYLNAINQGHLFNSYAEIIITTLLSRISEDSSTKFLQKQSYKTLEAFISCIDETITIQIMCTNSWDKFIRSNIRRNTIGNMLTFIFCNKLQTGKKNTTLFKRLGINGMERLLKVVHQLTNDKVSSTRLCGRRILEQLTLITDINKIYKQILLSENHHN